MLLLILLDMVSSIKLEKYPKCMSKLIVKKELKNVTRKPVNGIIKALDLSPWTKEGVSIIYPENQYTKKSFKRTPYEHKCLLSSSEVITMENRRHKFVSRFSVIEEESLDFEEQQSN